MSANANIVVLGAGVSGLTTTLLLARQGRHKITVIAKHMPGDYDIEYASPWAGADWVPPKPSLGIGNPDPNALPYEATTWPELEQLAKNSLEAGIHFQDAYYYRRAKDANNETGEWSASLMKKDHWLWKTVPKVRILEKSELAAGIDGGIAFTSVCINTAIYLPWLVGQCLASGVIVRRGIVSHVTEAADLHHSGERADIVINCTGLSSHRLGGVADDTLFPSRGQTVIVRNDPGVIAMVSSTDDGPNEASYVMTRAAGGGCVLGGSTFRNSWDSQPDPNLAIRIMERAIKLCPQLVPKGKGIEALSIIRHATGLRPMRTNGIRLEKETFTGADGRKLMVIHNYGHGGAGYQTSYGCSKVVEKLVEESLESKAML